jgi:hypothetical protein
MIATCSTVRVVSGPVIATSTAFARLIRRWRHRTAVHVAIMTAHRRRNVEQVPIMTGTAHSGEVRDHAWVRTDHLLAAYAR